MIKPSFIKTLNDCEISLMDSIVEAVFFNPVSSFFRGNFSSLKRIIRWTPVLWKQCDWDYEGIYDLIEQKMKDIYKEVRNDSWHDPREVNKCLRQISICLRRLAIIKNWTDFYDYPVDDITWENAEYNCKKMVHTSEENEKERRRICEKIDKNQAKFWKNFVKWHENWWT